MDNAKKAWVVEKGWRRQRFCSGCVK